MKRQNVSVGDYFYEKGGIVLFRARAVEGNLITAKQVDCLSVYNYGDDYETTQDVAECVLSTSGAILSEIIEGI